MLLLRVRTKQKPLIRLLGPTCYLHWQAYPNQTVRLARTRRRRYSLTEVKNCDIRG